MSQGWLKRLWLEYLRNDFEYKYNKAASQKAQAVHLSLKKKKNTQQYAIYKSIQKG